MNLVSKLMNTLQGMRGLEILVAVALAAALILYMGGTDRSDDIEARLEKTLSEMQGVGKVSVLINSDADGNVAGVLIVAEGADDMKVYLALQNVVSGLLDIDISHIEIAGMEGD